MSSESNKKRTALMAGASGLVGDFCLKKLLDSPNYEQVIALSRRPLEVNHPRLDNRIIDFDAMASEVGHLECDDVFCCLGTTINQAGSREQFRKVDFDYCMALAECGLESNASHFLLISALGAQANSAIFYLKVKGELEKAIETLGYDRFTIFQPSFLAGTRQTTRRAEALGIRATLALSKLLVGPFADYSVIEAEDLGNAMVLHALQTDSSAVQQPQRLGYRDIMPIAKGL